MSFAFTSSLSLCSKENSILDFYYIVHIWLLAITELFLQFSHYTRLRKKNTWLPPLEVLLGIFRLLFSQFYMRLLPLSPFLPRKMTHFNCTPLDSSQSVLISHKVSLSRSPSIVAFQLVCTLCWLLTPCQLPQQVEMDQFKRTVSWESGQPSA